MSIFATVAIVCTMSACNNYHIDSDTTEVGGNMNTQQHTLELQKAMPDEQKLNQWLNKYQIGETIFEIVSIDLETQQVEGGDIP